MSAPIQSPALRPSPDGGVALYILTFQDGKVVSWRGVGIFNTEAEAIEAWEDYK